MGEMASKEKAWMEHAGLKTIALWKAGRIKNMVQNIKEGISSRERGGDKILLCINLPVICASTVVWNVVVFFWSLFGLADQTCGYKHSSALF